MARMMTISREIRLGIAGTAKNTEKTTTTVAIIDELRERSIPFFLTSIGYDGENIDNITGTCDQSWFGCNRRAK